MTARISRCPACGTERWPPVPVCGRCSSATEEAPMEQAGTILAFSSAEGRYFCAARFGGVRLVCALESEAEPRAGQQIRLLREENGTIVASPGPQVI